MTDLENQLQSALIGSRRFFTKAEVSEDKRTLHKTGGREGDVFYRDRWSHDKVVRSTHGVNCTGSCSWKVYVKDGIITWEAQQTDYPSTGPDRPEYEPRGCPRGAAFSWYTYSPTRVRYPYVRGVLLEMFRAAKQQHGDPVVAWGSIVQDEEKARVYKKARGKGGLVRATWDEVVEIVAAAHVYTVKRWGPDRIAGFSPIPAMSPVSYASGARFLELIGAPMLSFYDWYADLPNASPADVRRPDRRPGVGRLVGCGLPVHVGLQRPDDPHARRPLDDRGALPRPEGRRRRAGLRREREVRRRVGEPRARHRRCAGDGDGARRPQGVLRRLHDALLRDLQQAVHRPAAPRLPRARTPPGPTAPASSSSRATSAGTARTPCGSRPSSTPPPARCASRTAPSATASATRAWASGTSSSATSTPRSACTATTRAAPASPSRSSCRASTRPTARSSTSAAACPVARVGDRVVTTVLDLMLAQYGVARDGLPGVWPRTSESDPHGYDDPSVPATPAWQEQHTGVPGRAGHPDRAGVGAERDRHRRSRHDPDGRRRQPLVPLRPDLPRDARAHHDHRLRRGATAAAGPTTSGRRRSVRSWASSTWPSRSTGTARRGT